MTHKPSYKQLAVLRMMAEGKALLTYNIAGLSAWLDPSKNDPYRTHHMRADTFLALRRHGWIEPHVYANEHRPKHSLIEHWRLTRAGRKIVKDAK